MENIDANPSQIDKLDRVTDIYFKNLIFTFKIVCYFAKSWWSILST